MPSFSNDHVKRPVSQTPEPMGVRVPRPLYPTQQATVTRPLEHSSSSVWLAETPTAPVSALSPRRTRPLNNPTSSPSSPLSPLPASKVPLVIPAEKKRVPATSRQRRSSRVFLGVLLGSIIVMAFSVLIVVPLGSGQHAQSLAQTVSGWFSSGQTSVFTTTEHPATPTATPALMTNEGYCGGHDIWGVCATAITASGVMGTGQMQHPIVGAVITQPFGHPEYQFWCGCWKPHTGIDLAAPYGSPIMAADSGQVIWTGWDWSGLGWAVKINHGHYIATIYGHMERFIVSVGQNVTKGQVIGYEGSTGASTGPHVHFMVLVNNVWVNPTLYVQLP